MPDLLTPLQSTLGQLGVRGVVDILVVAGIIYWLLVMFKGTTAVTLLRALAMVYLAGFVVSSVFQLTVVGWLLRNSLPAMFVVIPILFQPELRRVLEQVGRGFHGWRGGPLRASALHTIQTVADASSILSKRRVGALIVIEGETGLQEYVERSVKLDADLSAELLVGLFLTGSPFHDGATMIRRGRIVACRCVLPLSDNVRESVGMGTRHRAALGISERTDCIAIAVSEERGTVSIVHNGQVVALLPSDSADQIRSHLVGFFSPPRRNGRRRTDQPAPPDEAAAHG